MRCSRQWNWYTLNTGICFYRERNTKVAKKMLTLVLMPLFALEVGTTYGHGWKESHGLPHPLLVPVMMAVGFDSLTRVAIAPVHRLDVWRLHEPLPRQSRIQLQVLVLVRGITSFSLESSGLSWLDAALSLYTNADKIQRPNQISPYATREEDMKFFNVGENEEVNSTLTKKQKQVFVLFILTFVLIVLSLVHGVT